MENKNSRKNLDLGDLRERLQLANGPDYWRSLEELAQTDDFKDLVEREFPEHASEWASGVSRRNFLQLMGASLAFGGLTACTIQPAEKIVPYVRAPENVIPGRSKFYATTMPRGGVGTGILVESHMGRPTKIEGNPEHSASLGRSDSVTQASVLNLYDPDRATAVTNAGRISTWGSFLKSLEPALAHQRLKNGAGLCILTETVPSPTLGNQLDNLLKTFPETRWYQYEPDNRDNVRAGAVMAFGEPVNTYYDFKKADVVVTLDADFANSGPGSTRYAYDFASRRDIASGNKTMNRLYAVETTPTATGSIADHRIALGTAEIEQFALSLAQALGVDVTHTEQSDRHEWLTPLVRDLENHKGASAVVVGAQQSAVVHALAHAINARLGNVGITVHYTAPLESQSVDQAEGLRNLVADMEAGQIDALLILGGNPAFTSPADLDFAEAMEKVSLRVHLGLLENETSELCHWHIPESHYLESWGDIRAYDGSVSIIQPLIEPLYNSKSIYEVLAVLTEQTGKPVLEILKEYWLNQGVAWEFETFWQRSLHDGVFAGSRLPEKTVKLQSAVQVPEDAARQLGEEELELNVRPDPMIGDGRYANNGWLQETPKPISKLTWSNAAFVSPSTAQRLGVANEQVVDLSIDGSSVHAPVWILPGQAANVVTVHIGYGQKKGGRVSNEAGFDAYQLQHSEQAWSRPGLTVIKTFDRKQLACTQDHHSMEGRHLVRHGDMDEFHHHPDFAQHRGHSFPDDLTMYSGFDQSGYQWGMTIDLNKCIGCNACSVACQSENNIPIVGRDEVLNGREMPWIRVDRYFSGDLDNPDIHHQPIPCQQCENAPCEIVCPVTATSHSEEGLNDMVYNRCVGTRYCSNNCPYKVRRFNFLQYADRDSESLKLQRNPNVTTRSRGVMEKCTYCVQRINAARIDVKKRGDTIVDGQITTACEQSCPTDAIVFGNINEADSRVTKLKKSPLNYGILEDLNTRPRTTYLAKVRNPNPELIES